MNLKSTFPALVASWLLHPFLSSVAADEAGKLAYQMNCMACHQLDVKLVGPSLVAVAATYPKDKQAEFIAWAQAPGKKDPRLLQMPPMAHVPEDTLAAIHGYILEVSEGKTEKKGNHQFPFFKEPERKLPYVVRAFLPEASPASVAVILEHGISLCWDTEECRFRYAWTGGKTRLKQGHTVVKLEAEPFYRETSEGLWSFSDDTEPEFHGFRILKDGSPEFDYSIGGVAIRERIDNGAEPGSFVRHFTLSGAPGEVTLNLEQNTDIKVVANKGQLENKQLTLSGNEAESFTLTIFRP